MSEPCLATIKINVVVYKPRPPGEDGYDIVLVDSDSFVSALSSEDDHECSKEIKKLLQKTKKSWPKRARSDQP